MKCCSPDSEDTLGSLRSHIGDHTGRRHKYRDGEDPDEEMAAYDNNLPTLDIEILSRFSKLRSLELFGAPLNGRYPFLFNFPRLEKLRIRSCIYLKWDLEMLAAGLPLLKELDCYDSQSLTGTINSLRVLKKIPLKR